MREITVDLSKNNRERKKILAGKEGENSATKIFVILPDSLTSCLISGSSRTLSAIIQHKANGYTSEIEGDFNFETNIFGFILEENDTINGLNETEIVCAEIKSNIKERVGQTDPFFLLISPSVTGIDVIADENTVFNAKE